MIGIGLQRISFCDDMRKEYIRRWKNGFNFVQQGRAGWEPTKHFKIGSKHFKREDFRRMFTLLLDKKTSPWLKEDNLVPCVFPSKEPWIQRPYYQTSVSSNQKGNQYEGKKFMYCL